ncbi:MAG: efflux RND transporter periplasmic adaptor subunit [Planctomycetota bacterium]
MNAAEQTAAGPPGGTPSPPSSGGRRFRWPWRLTALALLLGAALLIGPPLAGGWLRGEFERLASAEIHGEVTRLNGKIDLEGLRVADEAGETVLFSPRGMIDVGLRSWLTGRKDLAVHVYGSELDVVRDVQGEWNVERLVASHPASTSDGSRPDAPGEGPRSGGDTPAPRRRPLDLHGRIEFADCTVVVRSPESALQLADVTFTVGLDGPEQSTAVRLEGHVFGGTGSVGDFYADLFLWPDAGPGLEIDRVDVTDLELGVLREAMRIAGVEADEELSLAGTVDVHVEGGAGDLRADAPYAVQATAELLGLRVEYPDGAGGLASIVEEAPVRLRAELASAGDGAGSTEGPTRFIAERFVDVGSIVNSSTPLVSLVALDPIVAVVFVPERDFSRLAVDQRATFTTDAYPGQSFSGRVARIAPVFRRSTRQVRVELEVRNTDLRLRPGMFVRATLELDHADEATVVPVDALITREGIEGVFVLPSGARTVRWAPVRRGLNEGGLVQVLGDGLSGAVVTLGQELCDDGSEVNVFSAGVEPGAEQ